MVFHIFLPQYLFERFDMNHKRLDISHLIELLKVLRGMSSQERSDFYEYKCNYYQFFVKICLTGGCLAAIMYIISDKMLNGSIMPTLIPRFSLIIPCVLFWIFEKKVTHWKVQILLDYMLAHMIVLSTIWAVMYLEVKDYFCEGTITMHLIFLTLCLGGYWHACLYSYILFYLELCVSHYFIHYPNFDLIIALNIPCTLAIIFAQFMLSLAVLDQYLMTQKLATLSVTDDLTQVGNRTKLEELISKESNEIQFPASLVMLDIDFFKNVNDTYGHPMGDQVLAYLGKFLRQSVRREDFVIRYGGEEFLIIFPNCLVDDCYKLMETIRNDISNADDRPVEFNISAGISEYDGDFEKSLKNADSALYTSKENGRNQVTIYSL